MEDKTGGGVKLQKLEEHGGENKFLRWDFVMLPLMQRQMCII